MLIDDGNNPLKLRWPWFGFATLAVVGLIVSIAIHKLAGGAYQAAWQHYLAGAQAVARGHAQDAAQSLGNIYQNIRTISYQPTVRKIDRHGGNLSEDGHETIQQNYNILASNVDVSEIYILPADFDPIKLDAVTLRPEEPILMFDHFIDDNAPNSRDLLPSSPAIEKGPPRHARRS